MKMAQTQTYLDLLEKSLPDSNHPAYQAWKKYALNAIERGKEVVEAIAENTSLQDKKVLDIGCGEGGTSIAFAKEGALVTAIDIDPARIKRTKARAEEHGVEVRAQLGDVNKTDFPDAYFDIIICQDVIEHTLNPELAVDEISRILKDGGYLFLTAPNRLSPLNLVRDPHYNLFGISVLPKSWAAFYAVKIRKRTANYSVEELPTLRWLQNIFGKKGISFKIDQCSEALVRKIIHNNFGSEKQVSKLISKAGLTHLLIKIARQRWFQFFIAPNWKLLGIKDMRV